MPERFEEMGDEVFRAQFRLIRDALAERQRDVAEADRIEIAVEPYDRRDVHYEYAAGRVIRRTDTTDDAGNADIRARAAEILPDSRLLDESLPEIDVMTTGGLPVPEALDRLDGAFGRGVFTPDHFVSITGVTNCPAIEPEPLPAGWGPWPPEAGGDAGRDVGIVIPDRGLPDRPPVHAWLHGVDGDGDDAVVAGNPVRLDEYAGHGVFAAGVARCAAPGSAVTVHNAFRFAGADVESFVAAALVRALDLDPDIVSLSAGGYTRFDLPSVLGQVVVERYLRERRKTILVAAAGNDHTTRPFWPAAHVEVYGVGALAFDQRGRAWFSNHGRWVDVWTLGDGMVNAYAEGRYTYRQPPMAPFGMDFHHVARWSGTSFSAPLFAGLVAARMSRTPGESSRQAADALVDHARGQEVPGAGPALMFDHVAP